MQLAYGKPYCQRLVRFNGAGPSLSRLYDTINLLQ